LHLRPGPGQQTPPPPFIQLTTFETGALSTCLLHTNEIPRPTGLKEAGTRAAGLALSRPTLAALSPIAYEAAVAVSPATANLTLTAAGFTVGSAGIALPLAGRGHGCAVSGLAPAKALGSTITGGVATHAVMDGASAGASVEPPALPSMERGSLLSLLPASPTATLESTPASTRSGLGGVYLAGSAHDATARIQTTNPRIARQRAATVCSHAADPTRA
jgi:hypothetical protein